MIQMRPTDEAELLQLTGVGEQKLQRYGKVFLAEIANYPLPALLDNSLSDTVNATLQCHLQGKGAETIAADRNLKAATIYTHFAETIAAGLLEPRDVLPLNDAEYTEIVNALELLGTSGDSPLKPVHEALEEKYDYGILRCVQAGL